MLHDGPMTVAPSSKPSPARVLPLAGRIFRQYVARQWVYVVIAIVCMLVTAAASGAIPLLIKYTTQYLFEQKRADMLLPITFAVVGIMVVRAASWFGTGGSSNWYRRAAPPGQRVRSLSTPRRMWCCRG